MKIDGGCHCGHLTYEAEINPEQVGVCHCMDCQTFSGSAFRGFALALEGTFKLLSGEPKRYLKTAASGHVNAMVFCPNCGTYMFDRRGARIDVFWHPDGNRSSAQRTSPDSADLLPIRAGVGLGPWLSDET